ncbi:hypothetical protein F7F69_28890, partial [Escherichia coli]
AAVQTPVPVIASCTELAVLFRTRAPCSFITELALSIISCVYTQEMMERANSVMNEQGALVLNNTASSVQLAMTGTGVWTAA